MRALITALAGLTLFTAATPAAAQLPAEARTRLQQAVERCGKAYGTLVKGQRPFDAGPFLYELLSAADRLGATDPERRNLRLDFSNTADRLQVTVDAAPGDLAGEVAWCKGWRG